MVILDVETYRDYFLLSMKRRGGRPAHFEHFEGNPFDRKRVAGILASNTTVGFNSNSYDLLMIVAALQGMDNAALKSLSDSIIQSDRPSWQIARDNHLSPPETWDHIDLIEVAPGKASLKLYGGRLHAKRLQDLPLPPDASITPDLRPLMRSYCENDLDTTALLLDALEKPIELRERMSDQYGVDLRSKSDAQIAETVIRSELQKRTGKRHGKVKLRSNKTFRYKDPGVIRFRDESLQRTLAAILDHPFELQANGAVMLPQWLKETRIEIGSSVYRMGIGGLHSSEKGQFVEAGDGALFDLDVASYYPSIILQQGLAPETMGQPFLDVYRSLVDARLTAKAGGDKSTADSLKIAINGSFGKLGSKYSVLYAPDLLIQTTLTGQLALLMLIERVERAGAKVVSANTDGAVIWCDHTAERLVEEAAWEWMLDTSYDLERTDYLRLASRDVNNYVAVKPDGSTKGKGCFADTTLMKNPDRNIVAKSVAERIANGTPIDETVKRCVDLREFVTVRTVRGGATWNGEALGKAVRFYSSRSVPEDQCIHYATNGNRVPRSAGCMPVMDLPDEFPNDVDYDSYIVDAEKLLAEVGGA